MWEVDWERNIVENEKEVKDVGKDRRSFEDAWGAVRKSWEIVSHPQTSW